MQTGSQSPARSGPEDVSTSSWVGLPYTQTPRSSQSEKPGVFSDSEKEVELVIAGVGADSDADEVGDLKNDRGVDKAGGRLSWPKN